MWSFPRGYTGYTVLPESTVIGQVVVMELWDFPGALGVFQEKRWGVETGC